MWGKGYILIPKYPNTDSLVISKTINSTKKKFNEYIIHNYI